MIQGCLLTTPPPYYIHMATRRPPLLYLQSSGDEYADSELQVTESTSYEMLVDVVHPIVSVKMNGNGCNRDDAAHLTVRLASPFSPARGTYPVSAGKIGLGPPQAVETKTLDFAANAWITKGLLHHTGSVSKVQRFTEEKVNIY